MVKETKHIPFPSRAGFQSGKGMQVLEDGNGFILTAVTQRTQSFRSLLFYNYITKNSKSSSE